jgi:high affinity Mn2+ porin
MFVNRLLLLPFALAAVVCLGQTAGQDAVTAEESPRAWSIHFQVTSIGQHHGPFPSPYEGENSLPSHSENRVSLTGTIFTDLRLDRHWDFVVDPELAGGEGFGGVTGIAGFPNGEIPRVAQATPTVYLARGYVRYTAGLGGGLEELASEPNQTVGAASVNRLSLIAGKFAITDFFDDNTYSHDPRTQFMNWAIMYNGAWDYPADTRGYTAGLVEELKMNRWWLRAACILEPTEANGPTLDTRVGDNRGVVVELERRWVLAGRSGALRVFGFDNRADAGTYREAMRGPGQSPDLASTQRNGTQKHGFGLNFEQALSPDAGVFARYGWNDGKAESWAFTEIDRTVSGGVLVHGRMWNRAEDSVGAAYARNYLSGDHASFLAAGGYGFIIGDGRLTYSPEQIFETFYALHLVLGWTVTLDYQRIVNPAYNRDRGPVNVASLRLHWER